MPYALISLILVQIGFVAASGLLYARMRSKADAEKAAMVPWGIRVEAAVGTADSAKRAVEMIELEHYKNLRALFESQALQIGNLKGENEALKREIEQLSTKVQTLQRMDRHERKRESAAAAAASPGPGPIEGSESDPLAEMIANGQAIPLRPPAAAQRPAGKGRFGQIP